MYLVQLSIIYLSCGIYCCWLVMVSIFPGKSIQIYYLKGAMQLQATTITGIRLASACHGVHYSTCNGIQWCNNLSHIVGIISQFLTIFSINTRFKLTTCQFNRTNLPSKKQRCNRVTTADPDDPDTNPGQTRMWPGLNKTEACAKIYFLGAHDSTSAVHELMAW